MRSTVLGAGSWGTALASVLASKGYPVTLWGRDAPVLDAVMKDHENPHYLPGHQAAAVARGLPEPGPRARGGRAGGLRRPQLGDAPGRHRVEALPPRRDRGGLGGQGHRGGQPHVHGRGARGRAAGGHAPVPRLHRRPLLRPRGGAADAHRHHRGRALGPGDPVGAGRLPHPLVPPLHLERHPRQRAGRRGEERHRHRGRHVRRARVRRQRAGRPHHPRASPR